MAVNKNYVGLPATIASMDVYLCPVSIGEKANAALSAPERGYGIPVTTADAAASYIHANDGASTLGSGEYCGTWNRFLLTKAVASSADVTISGLKGQLKVYGVSVAGIANKAGLCGYLEVDSAGTIGGGGVNAGVWGRVDCPSGCTIDTGATLAAFATGYNDLGGTHTGKAACIHIGTPKAGVWDGLFNIISAGNTTIYQASDVGSAASKKLVVLIDGSAYAIKLYDVS